MDSPFEVLGIEQDADDEAIKEAYRRRVKDAHPDHGGSAGEFRRVRAAYEELTSGERRDELVLDADGPETVDESDASSGPAASEGTDDPVGARVEYLNYEVLDDEGWTLADDDLFEKASAADLDPVDYGRFRVQPDETLLQAAENRGFAWPFACRGGACANCAVAVLDGELDMPVDHILPPEMTDSGIQLSCVGRPITEEMQVVYNVKHLPDLDELRLPPRPFKQAQSDD